MSQMLILGLVLIGGVTVALQAKIMGGVDEKIGTIGNMVLTYAIGFLVGIIIFFTYGMMTFGRNEWSDFYGKLLKFQWWELLGGGVCGLLIVGTIGLGASRLGAVTTLVIIIFSQIVMGLIADHYGWFSNRTYPVTLSKIIGLMFVFVGILVLFKK